ncbi:hypothetical protein BUALT_Bualt15G0063400 [Buddleja alternifolia]|uniref:Uncharacterized protein n=1 Tax=Buddleja alternifolia TaxID=168488 RepID=A0AAV6WKU2_9LAMI|nr:hypothetical protein BUALT_Bualt15G0063400 [Buddleja alternifolia]
MSSFKLFVVFVLIALSIKALEKASAAGNRRLLAPTFPGTPILPSPSFPTLPSPSLFPPPLPSPDPEAPSSTFPNLPPFPPSPSPGTPSSTPIVPYFPFYYVPIPAPSPTI